MALPWFQSHTAKTGSGQRWSVHFSVGHDRAPHHTPHVRILGAPPNDDVQVLEILVNGIQQLEPNARIPAYLLQRPLLLPRCSVLYCTDQLEVVLRARVDVEITVEYAGLHVARTEGWFSVGTDKAHTNP